MGDEVGHCMQIFGKANYQNCKIFGAYVAFLVVCSTVQLQMSQIIEINTSS